MKYTEISKGSTLCALMYRPDVFWFPVTSHKRNSLLLLLGNLILNHTLMLDLSISERMETYQN